jgi:hypothetical protein
MLANETESCNHVVMHSFECKPEPEVSGKAMHLLEKEKDERYRPRYDINRSKPYSR